MADFWLMPLSPHFCCRSIGVVAVPVYPPDPRSKLRKDILAFTHTVHSCGASVALTSSAYGYAKKVAGLVNILKGEGIKSAWPADLIWVETDHVSSRSVRGARNSKSSAAVSDVSTGSLDSSSQQSHLAFLQYTSGSTSDPKGVRISHGNLAHNLTVIVQELQVCCIAL
jgi:acyl-CoA synthetase (AMP-forming)/AMP-acid ligase II